MPYMAILGIGIDIVEIARMHDAVHKADRFMTNTFTDTERAYCDTFADASTHYAGTFAAKEAVRKATGELSRSFRDIEIIRNEHGKPEVWTDGTKRTTLHVSITHTEKDASAIAILES